MLHKLFSHEVYLHAQDHEVDRQKYLKPSQCYMKKYYEIVFIINHVDKFITSQRKSCKYQHFLPCVLHQGCEILPSVWEQSRVWVPTSVTYTSTVPSRLLNPHSHAHTQSSSALFEHSEGTGYGSTFNFSLLSLCSNRGLIITWKRQHTRVGKHEGTLPSNKNRLRHTDYTKEKWAPIAHMVMIIFIYNYTTCGTVILIGHYKFKMKRKSSIFFLCYSLWALYTREKKNMGFTGTGCSREELLTVPIKILS